MDQYNRKTSATSQLNMGLKTIVWNTLVASVREVEVYQEKIFNIVFQKQWICLRNWEKFKVIGRY